MAPLETTVTPNSKDVREGGQEASPKRESGGSAPSLWGRRQSGIDAARGWSSEVTSCGRSDLKVGAK